MQIDDANNFERVWFFTFAVQRLGRVADAVAAWMGGMPPSPQRADRELMVLARRLGDQHASFLARPAQGDIGALLAEAQTALQHFAATLDALPAYPAAAAEAAALRREAARCAALRPR